MRRDVCENKNGRTNLVLVAGSRGQMVVAVGVLVDDDIRRDELRRRARPLALGGHECVRVDVRSDFIVVRAQCQDGARSYDLV